MPKVLIAATRDLTEDLGRTILWSDGVERIVASTPTAALEVARAFVPSMAVVEGPEADALAAFIRRLRESPGTRRSSIVALTRSPEAEADLLRAGANLVLSGPADPARWDAPIARLLTVPQRARVQFPVHLQLGAQDLEPVTGLALDVSVGGILVQTGAPLSTGSTCKLSFTLPDDTQELAVEALVVRVSRGLSGQAGMRFVDPPPEVSRRIRALLEAAAPDRSFGRYEVLGLLGEGAMGRVYRAFDPLARRVVAIKTPHPECLVGPEAQEYMRRFRREAQAAAHLAHPNIVTVFDVGDDYFAMELLEGATLLSIVNQRGSLAPDEACRLLRPLAAALDHAHAKNTIHRDIKSANIIVLADGRPKIMDFGVAHLASAVITGSGQTFGSPAYMAPEQVLGGSASPLSDLFSFAVVAYEAVTGRKPFEGQSITPVLYQVVNAAPPPPSHHQPALPAHYDQVFRRALAKDPWERFPSATAFVDALEGKVPVEAFPHPPAEHPRPSPPGTPAEGETIALSGMLRFPSLSASRPRLARAAAVLLALAVVLAVALRPGPRRSDPPPPPPGLQVTTAPPGATVVLDGKPVGVSPLFLPAVSPGAHVARVELKDHAPAVLSFTVSGSVPSVPLRFVLEPLTATLEIQSEPSPAFARVDGESVGATPLSALSLPPGVHQVGVERPGYQPWSQLVEPRAGELLRVFARLQPTGGVPPGGAAGRGDWVRRGDLVDLGPGVIPPSRITGGLPPYPETARRLGIRGTVTVELTVGEEGTVLNPRVVDSAGEILDQAMLAAVRRWRYAPATSNGVQVRVRIREHHTFAPAN